MRLPYAQLMTARSELLVTAAELAAIVRAEADLPPGAPRTRVLHLNWTPVAPTGEATIIEGHIPGAVKVDSETELAAHGPATLGRHPLPGAEAITASARSWGLHPGDSVVAYDTDGNLGAARLWWMLKDAGFSRVRLLDGGLAAWSEAGLPLETEDTPQPEPGTVTLTPGRMPRLELDEVAQFARDHVLLDARSQARYAGETEPIDPVAGHIPGAHSLPTINNIDAEGYFLGDEALADQFEAAGASKDVRVGVYCGSGVTASHEIFALALAGVEAALYPGSWSQWSNHPDLPVAVGSMP